MSESKHLIEIIDSRIQKEKTQYAATVISVENGGKKATVVFPNSGMQAVFLNKSNEILTPGDCVYVYSNSGDLTNGFISYRFGEAKWLMEEILKTVQLTTEQKIEISNPIPGMVVYDLTLNKLCLYTSTWEVISSN